MFRTDPGPDRARLGFAEAVLSAFNFMTKEYGFRLVKADPTFVRYESADVFVNVYHGRASYELGFEIGRLIDSTGQGEHPFSLAMVIELMGAQKETGYALLQASSSQRVKKLVPKLADLVKKYTAPALEGDSDTFKLLAKTRARMSDELHKDMKLSDTREDADKAWREKNYSKLASLYDSISEDLTAAERKKLDYAKKQRSR